LQRSATTTPDRPYFHHQPILFPCCLPTSYEYFIDYSAASLCKNYQNLVKNTKPIYNFKGTIEPLQNNLVIFALINLSLLIVNAAIILFSYKIKRFWVYFIPLTLTVLGMAVSMGAPINVMLTVKEWNNLNQSSFNTFTVYSSVFVGDLSGI
jgi:hypothetical protein